MSLLYPPYECTWGMRWPPPRPQTLHRSHDNLKNPYRIVSIFYMYVDIGERIAGKQDGLSLVICAIQPPPPPPPLNSQKCKKNHIGAYRYIYMKNRLLFFLWICLLSDLTALKFSFSWVRRKGPPPPNILDLKLKISYQIAFLFDMYIDMGERIAGKQDRPSLIIDPENILFFLHFGPYMKNWFSNCFLLLYICLHCDEVCIC